MNKRSAVEFFFHQGFTPDYAYGKLYSKYPDLTYEWVEEVYDELAQQETDADDDY